jgi:hypothetical protein
VLNEWGRRYIDAHFLVLSTSWRWVVSFTPLLLYPRGKGPRYPLDRRLIGPQSRSGRFGEEKILDPTRLELRPSVVQPVASSYPGFPPTLTTRNYAGRVCVFSVILIIRRDYFSSYTANCSSQRLRGLMHELSSLARSNTGTCSLLKVNRRFGATYRLYLLCRRINQSRNEGERTLHNHHCENLESYII